MKILCVTKCPTGMVQTYVAAEKLEQAGKKLGIDLSVETQGAMGIQNQFSPEQIDEADYIVIAADVAIDEASRFGNKKLYVTSLEDAIVHPEQILESLTTKSYSYQDATGESDLQLLSTTQKLYQQYDLKRVFYSAYVPLNEDSNLPALGTAPPLLREHRLYQADWLLRFYGFKADELLSVDRPNFNTMLDPKCDWALRHLGIYPVEINRASYDVLLRVPGIGTKSAFRIVKARKHGTLNFEHLKQMGIVLKRAKYFITCSGKMMYRIPIEEDFITRQLIGEDGKQNWEIDHPQTYRQLSLFDDFNFQSEVTVEDSSKTLFGQM